jgi:hypothetical protein
VLNALVDTGLTVQLEALGSSEHAPLRQRVGKVIDEEYFHAAHGLAWARRLGTTAEGRAELAAAVSAAYPVVARWFGSAGDTMRGAWQERIAPVLDAAGAGDLARSAPDFQGFSESTRRVSAGGPDPATITRVRGDKNRAFLMD